MLNKRLRWRILFAIYIAGICSITTFWNFTEPVKRSTTDVPTSNVKRAVSIHDLGAPRMGFVDCPPGAPSSRELAHLPIDIVLKTRSEDSDLLFCLYSSLSLFWPDYDSLIVVLDGPADYLVVPMSMPRTRWIIEPLELIKPRADGTPYGSGYLGQMWSNMWADNYTSAPLVAIIDSDTAIVNRVDRASLTYRGELIVRLMRCTLDQTSPEAYPHDPFTRHFEGGVGCMYSTGCEYLLKRPCIGNFMVEVPFILPRAIFAPLRAHVEKEHNKPFDTVMAEIVDLCNKHYGSGSFRFSQQSTLGSFLFAFSDTIPDLLLGTGLSGIRYSYYGREPVFPHVGRHLGQENSDVAQDNLKRGGRHLYSNFCMMLIHRAVCRTFSDADPALCAHTTYPKEKIYALAGSHHDVDLYSFEVRPGKRTSDIYDAAVSKICRYASPNISHHVSRS
jgi:hypothetical protein